MTVIRSDFEPDVRFVSSVTTEFRANVTTVEDHGFNTGDTVRLLIPEEYGMTLNLLTRINVTSSTTFETELNTIDIEPFSAPVFPPSFKEAQTISLNGPVKNIA